MSKSQNIRSRKIKKPNWELYGYKWAIDVSDARRRAKEAKTKGKDELDGELCTAIRYRDVIHAKELLALGANPNVKDSNRCSALGHAIQSGVLEAVDLLLDYGADPDLLTGLATPITNCIYEEKWDLAGRLLRAGADVNAMGSIRCTALHVCVEHSSNVAFAELLVNHGADLTAKNVEGRTPLEVAIRARRKRMVEFLERIMNSRQSKSKARGVRSTKKT